MSEVFELGKNLNYGSVDERITAAAALAHVSPGEREHAVHLLRRSLQSSDGRPLQIAIINALESLGDRELLIAERYRPIRQLGEGAFGRCTLAYDGTLKRHVAIKELALTAMGQSDLVMQFQTEARILAELNHPNVVCIYDFVDGERIVMEWLEGGSVADRLHRVQRIMVSDAVPIILDVLAALEAAHSRDIIHRDIKPGNVLFRGTHEAKVSDFGIAYVPALGERSEAGDRKFHPGTLLYMSPEQIRGEPLDSRSDLYSVGALLFEMLIGESYIDEPKRTTPDSIVGAILRDHPRKIGSLFGWIPKGVDRVLAALMDKQPQRRPASADEARLFVKKTLGTVG